MTLTELVAAAVKLAATVETVILSTTIDTGSMPTVEIVSDVRHYSDVPGPQYHASISVDGATGRAHDPDAVKAATAAMTALKSTASTEETEAAARAQRLRDLAAG